MIDPDGDVASEQRASATSGGPACCRASGRTSGTAPPIRGGVRRREARSCSCALGGGDVSTRTSTSRPSQNLLRSSPIRSWRASSSLSRRRLTSGGTSSGSRVAGVRSLASTRPRRPGRTGRPRADASVARNCGFGLAAEPDDHVGRDVMPGTASRMRSSRPGSARSCTGGPSGGGPHRRRTGPAGGGARRPPALGQRRDQPIREVPRMRGHEPEARRSPDGRRPCAAHRWPG